MPIISSRSEAPNITDGIIQVDLPDINAESGYKSYYIVLEDYISAISSVETYANFAALPVSGTANILYITLNDFAAYIWDNSQYNQVAGGGGGHTIQNEGSPLTQRSNLNFIGAGVDVTDNSGSDSTDVTITVPDITGLLDETAHDLLDHTGLTGIPSITGLLDETAHDLLDHTGLIGVGTGDMTLAGIQSVTGLKTFDKDKAAMKGTSTGVNTISVANTSATSYTNTIPAKTGTFAMTDTQLVDATVGTCGDYATIYAAVQASKYNLKLLSNITESQTFTLSANTVLIIYLNNFNVNFANCACNQPTNTSRVIFNGPGSVTSTQTDTARVFLQGSNTDFYNCTFTNASNQANSAVCTSGVQSFYNCSIVLPNVSGCGLGTNNNYSGTLSNVIISGGGASASWTIYEVSTNTNPFVNLYITARGTVGLQSPLSQHTGIYLNQANSTLLLTGETKATGVYNTGATRIDTNAMIVNFEINTVTDSNDGAIFTNGVINGAVSITSKNSYIFTNVTFLSNLALTTDYHKVISCKIAGTTTLNSGAEYNTLIGNTFTGAFTNSSGNTTNIILANYGIANNLTEAYTFTNLAGSGDRIVQTNSAGLLSASIPVITGKLSDSTAINLLINTSNWDVDGAYTGTAITGTYEGQYYSNSEYYFTAYSDNVWLRLPRA